MSETWNDEVEKERAKLHAQSNPNPPLKGKALVAVFVFGAVAAGLCAYAWFFVAGAL